ncbi:ABC efflux transporter-like protein (plasmid) [Paenibacillus larvae subsp. larvae DSM 25430]|nr:ABC efflux transporter-like protein [Paenibacillus larvae subsp. larvae DSM 25430]
MRGRKEKLAGWKALYKKKSEPQGQTSKKPSGPKPRFMFHVHANPVHRIIEATNLIVGYFEPLFGPIDLLVKRGEKIAVVGHNGIESILREKRRPRIIAVIQGLRFDYTVLRFIRNIFC